MVISGEAVCCSVVFGTLVGVLVFSVRIADDSVRVPECGVCVHISVED